MIFMKQRIKYLFFPLVMIVGIYVGCSGKRKNTEPKWQLVWTEDFSGPYLDTAVWGYMKRSGDDSRKYHSSNPACYEFRDGNLIIKCIRNPNPETDTETYLTGAIPTEKRRAFASGKIEIRAKIGNAKGAWPAFWMLPFKKDKGWPADGEIDIMEHLNFDKYVYQSLHSAYTRANGKALPKRSVKPNIRFNDYNIYGVVFTEDYIRFYVNGKETLTYPKVDSLLYKGEYPFYRDWYLMLDMQLGGSWVGSIDSNDLPVEMEVDWVKYYQKK